MQRNKQQAPIKKTAAQQERREKLKSLHVKRQSLDAIHDGTPVLVEKERGVDDAVGINTDKRKSFWKIDDEEHGVYFQDVETDETVWELPKDGDVVMEDDELQQNPMKRKSFIKIDDEEHGVYFQDVETEETVWELPEDGDVVVEDNELQQNPMKRKSFRKIVDDEHGVFFQDVDTEETVWKLPEDGEVVVS